MPLAAPPPPPAAPADAPPAPAGGAEPIDLRPPQPPQPSSGARVAGPRGSDLLARICLVLSAVVALAGVLTAVARAGDDGPSRRSAAAADPLADEDPLSGGGPVEVEVPAGFAVRHGEGVSLAVPADWMSLDRDDIRRIVSGENVELAFPDLSPEMLDAVGSAVDHGSVFMAIDVSGADAGRNINLMRIPGEAPLGILERQLGDQFAELGFPAEVLGTSRRDTSLGRGLRVRLRETVAGEELEVVQYYVPYDGATYVVTGTGADDVVDRAVQTLRTGDPV